MKRGTEEFLVNTVKCESGLGKFLHSYVLPVLLGNWVKPYFVPPKTFISLILGMQIYVFIDNKIMYSVICFKYHQLSYAGTVEC